MEKVNALHQIANPERSNIALSEKVREIDAKLEKDRGNAQLWMERGLALSDQMLFREAVEAYSEALAIDPFCGILYRHRGHRHISCREYIEAAADFEMAARLIPDNWDVWYHLGLSYFLLRDYVRAEKAYKRCYEISLASDKLDGFCACTDWYWRTLRRLGKKEEADKLIERVDANMDPEVDWVGYSRNVLLYKGVIKPEELIAGRMRQEDLAAPTMAFCLCNYYAEQGDMEKSNEVLDMLLDFCKENWWSAFGYLAGLNEKEDRKRA